MLLTNLDRRSFLSHCSCLTCGLLTGTAALGDERKPPKVSCTSALPRMERGFGLVQSSFFTPTVDMVLDRDSFLKRGWREDWLGTLGDVGKPGSQTVYISMVHALNVDLGNGNNLNQMNLGELIKHYAKQNNKEFGLHVYEGTKGKDSPPNMRGRIVARKRNEYPFNEKGLEQAIGAAPGPEGEIYILADLQLPLRWGLGWGMTDEGGRPYQGKNDGSYEINLTHVIAHEMGHCFGIGHFDSEESVMHSAHQWGANTWQKPRGLVDALNGVVGKIK